MTADHIQARVQQYDFDSYKWEPLAKNTEDWTQQNHPEWLELTSDQDYYGDNYFVPDILPKLIYVMLGVLGIITLVFAIIKYCRKNTNNTSQSQSRNHFILPRVRSRIAVRRDCQHRPCIINRYSNRYDGCLLKTNNGRHRDNIAYQFATIVPANNDWNLESHRLDLSSMHSLHNLNHNSTNQISSSNYHYHSAMLPSYEEALAYTFVSSTSAGRGAGNSSGGGDSGGGGGGDSGGGGGGDSGGGGGDSGGGGGGND